MFLDKGFKDQIRYVAYVPGMAGNLADRWGLSHLEPTKPQSSTIYIDKICPDLSTNMFLDEGFKEIRYVAYVPGMAGNPADRWGLLYLEPTKPHSILIKYVYRYVEV